MVPGRNTMVFSKSAAGSLGRFVDVLELVFAKLDHVVGLQKVLFDRLPVDQCSVGRTEVLQKRVVQNRDDHSVLTRDRKVIDLNVVVRLAADGGALLGQGNFLEHQPVHAEN